MKWNRIKAVIRKDLREITSNKMVILPMIIVPLIFCIIMPVAFILISLLADAGGINGLDTVAKLLPSYPIPASFDTLPLQFLFIFLNYTFIPFFMLIPIMVSSIIASNAIVGEKERKTLETLLYTPITNGEFIVAKLLSSFIPAVIVSFGGFLLFFVTGNAVSLAVGGIAAIRSPIWIPAMVLLSPAVSLLGLSVTLMVSLKAKTFMEAQQTAGVIVVPFVILVVVQITGVVIFKEWLVVLFSVLLFGLDYLFIGKLSPRFSRERIIMTL
jgi:ABC-type transport system involved in multi-copper enzyme maturation permease subunit